VHAGTPQVKALGQHLALGVSGLFYYVGSLLQYLIQEGIYRQEVPNVYLCGNGSRIFRWLDIDNEKSVNALYQAVFAQGAGWKDHPPFQVIFSEDLKKEAAYGLAWDSDLQGGTLPRKILAGESFIAEEQEVRRRLGQNLSRYHQVSETANIVVEPVFIVALRNWLEIRLGG
jgi:hypothetical protein